MLLVNGIGQHRFNQYGEIFIALIEKYLADRPEISRPTAKTNSTPLPPPRARAAEETETRVGAEDATREFFEKGYSIEQVAAERNLRPETILNHLEKLMKNGAAFSPEQFLDVDRMDMIHQLFRDSGGTLLRPVVEASGDTVSYLEARLARLFLVD